MMEITNDVWLQVSKYLIKSDLVNWIIEKILSNECPAFDTNYKVKKGRAVV